MGKYDVLIAKIVRFELLSLGGRPQTITAYRSGYGLDLDSPAQHGSLGPGYYFTTSVERAKKYAGDHGSVVMVEIRLQNPLAGPKQTIAKQFSLENHYDEEDTRSYDPHIGKKLSELAREQGYDGIIATESNGVYHEIVAFDRNSITPIKVISNK